uniref:T-cell surface antigen CD2 n=1 Tax=Sus scrofa TaxID=9823 RepID=A0A4X1SVF6_PIG
MRRHTHRHACFSKGTHQPGTVSQITEVVWGIVDQDINLDIPELSKHDNVDHIRWQKNENKIAEFKKNKETHPVKDTYMMLPNGTLRIKDLKRDDEGIYKVTVYATDGKHMLERKFDLQILDGVSKPVISWSCANKTVTCEVAEGSDPKLKLYVNKSTAREGRQKVILWKWNTKWSTLFKCVASNNASEQISMVTISCTGQGLDIYLIIGICGGGTVFLIFIALLIFYTSKRKKQSSRRNGKPPSTVPPPAQVKSPWQQRMGLALRVWKENNGDEAFQNVRAVAGGYSLFHFVVSLIFKKHILSGDNVGALRSSIQDSLTGIHHHKAVGTHFEGAPYSYVGRKTSFKTSFL